MSSGRSATYFWSTSQSSPGELETSFYWNIYSLFVLNWKYPFRELLLRVAQDKDGVQNINHSHQLQQNLILLLFKLSCDGLGWQL